MVAKTEAEYKGTVVRLLTEMRIAGELPFGMPVEVVYKDALGRKDREGNSYVSYFFQPRR